MQPKKTEKNITKKFVKWPREVQVLARVSPGRMIEMTTRILLPDEICHPYMMSKSFFDAFFFQILCNFRTLEIESILTSRDFYDRQNMNVAFI